MVHGLACNLLYRYKDRSCWITSISAYTVYVPSKILNAFLFFNPALPDSLLRVKSID